MNGDHPRTDRDRSLTGKPGTCCASAANLLPHLPQTLGGSFRALAPTPVSDVTWSSAGTLPIKVNSHAKIKPASRVTVFDRSSNTMTRSTAPFECRIRISPERKQAWFLHSRLPSFGLRKLARRRALQSTSTRFGMVSSSQFGLFSSKTSIIVHLNMSEGENGQLPLAKSLAK